MAYLYAVLGFIALIILHEAGHFAAAKAVGMRVERFALFFPPLIAKVRRGETEYGIGALPFGGYVKITGMNPNEEIPPEVVPRAYYNQSAWKRIVVIAAGPLVNIVIAFGIIVGLLLAYGQADDRVNRTVAAVERSAPAAHALKPGDTLVSVDGRRGSAETLRRQVATHRCAGTPTNGCRATTPARLVVRRDGRLVPLSITPRYATTDGQSGMFIGITFGVTEGSRDVGLATAAGQSGKTMWSVTEQTVTRIAKLFKPEDRKQVHGIVGSYTVTERSFAVGTEQALAELALISLALGIVNLFPFLPLDGGHIFWAVAEKVRGRRISFRVMERAGAVGFVLILLLFVVGLSNDISSLSNGGLQVR